MEEITFVEIRCDKAQVYTSIVDANIKHVDVWCAICETKSLVDFCSDLFYMSEAFVWL